MPGKIATFKNAICVNSFPEAMAVDLDVSKDWRQSLRKFLSAYLYKEVWDQVIDFLQFMFKDAIKSVQSYKKPLDFITVELDLQNLPLLFSRDSWGQLLDDLGFAMELPDSLISNKLDLVAVFLTDDVTEDSLHCVNKLLRLLKDLPFTSVKSLLAISHKEGNELLRTMTQLKVYKLNIHQSIYKEQMKALYVQKTQLMKELGFEESGKDLLWSIVPQQEKMINNYMFILNVLFYDQLRDIPAVVV